MRTTPKSPNDVNSAVPTPVQEELRLLALIQRAIQRPAQARVREDYEEQWLRLREDLADAHLPEDRASLLEQMERISHLASARAKHTITRADPASPYFGHMRLRDYDGQKREVFIGKQTHIDSGVNIVDWRHAPISKVFYQCSEGDEYAVTIAGREAEGEVLLRRTMTIAESALRHVGTPEASFSLLGDGQWRDISAHRPSLRGGSGASARNMPPREDRHLPEIASLLDPQQFALITHPDSGLIAIQGSAGSGKTTVALHRAAYLAFQDERRFKPAKMLIIVFNRALAQYISHVLPALGVEGVRVSTFEAWVRPIRKQLFPHLPDRYQELTPVLVSRFKQHSVLFKMLTEAAAASPYAHPSTLLDELLTDLGWLREGVRRLAPGAFSDEALVSIHDWCVRQFSARLHVEEDDPPALDVEDDSLLLFLHQRLRGPIPKPRNKKKALTYHHLIIDEAQDFSALDLSVLFGCVEPNHPITLAGDTAQKIVENNDFDDWVSLLNLLGYPHTRISPLHISYRSTSPIMSLAHHVLGHLAPAEPPTTTRDGVPVERFEFTSHGQAFTFLGDIFLNLQRAEPKASIAILSRYPYQADLAFDALSHAELRWLRRIQDQNFDFSPGIDVTDIRQAKGLEFDYVVLLDVDAQTYPLDDLARHLLHVGITRAAHQCWIFSVGTPSPLLPASLRPSIAA
jgi:DNA helicase-2/ATP-dependent DNA helicase PcrA